MRPGRLVFVLLISMLVFGAVVAQAEAPTGARLAVVISHPYSEVETEATSFAPDGTDPFRITGGPGATGPSPVTQAQLSWSADGSRVAFLGGVRNGGSGLVFTVAADGSDPKAVPFPRKLLITGNPVLAPDGRSVAMTRTDLIGGPLERPLWRGRPSHNEDRGAVRTAIWSFDVEGSKMRRLSTWLRGALLAPSSFSPDGSHLVASEWGFGPTPRAVSIDLSTRRTTVLADNARDPVYAPDGRVAIVRDHFGPKQGPEGERKRRSSTLLVVPAEGGRPRPLVRIRPGLSSPSWDPSGQRIAFTRLSGRPGKFSLFPGPNSIVAVNADGTCLTTVAKLTHGLFSGSTWQPGPGREAGPITC